MDSDVPAWCPLCGQKFCNIFALDEHFTIFHDGYDGLIPSEKTLLDGGLTDDVS